MEAHLLQETFSEDTLPGKPTQCFPTWLADSHVEPERTTGKHNRDTLLGITVALHLDTLRASPAT